MQSLHKLGLITVLLTAAVSFSSSPVHAYMHQEQSQSSSSTTSFSCDGNCGKVETSTKTEVNQSQSQTMSSHDSSWMNSTWDDENGWQTRHGNRRWVSFSDNWNNNDGQVRLNWGMRGGTCYVRYTEAKSGGWNYNTSTACDDGGITIGGLMRGKNYRFQVKKDDGSWSKTRTLKAW